ncbi:Quino protein amine dehydrogenase [Mycena vulgaris]|nr:Quino protein amine dehydrogenase [Mycena vulgaris]
MSIAVHVDKYTPRTTFSLAAEFQQNGVPVVSGSWVSEVASEGDTARVDAVAISHNNTLVAAGAGRKVRVYDAATARLLHTLRGHTGDMCSLEFHPGGRKLASSSPARKAMIRVWDLEAPVRDPDEIADGARSAAAAAAVSFSPDSRHFAAGASRGALRVFDVQSGRCEQDWQLDLGQRRGAIASEIHRVQYTPRGDLFFSSDEAWVYGYSASRDFVERERSSEIFSLSLDGSKLIVGLHTAVGIWNVD